MELSPDGVGYQGRRGQIIFPPMKVGTLSAETIAPFLRLVGYFYTGLEDQCRSINSLFARG